MPCPVNGSALVAGAINNPQPNAELARARSSLVPNGDFADGLRGWLISKPVTAQLERSDRDDGQKLHVVADPSMKLLYINSSRFPVTSGAGYHATIGARIAPTSAGSGSFSVVFLSSLEVGRDLGRFDPPNEPAPYVEYKLAGTVPPGAREAFVQVSYDPREATIDLSVYGVGYAETGVVEVTGWAIDGSGPGSGGANGIDNVSLYLDGPPDSGTFIGKATYGDKRDEIARACSDARLANSGWHVAWDIGAVAVGEHTLYAVTRAASGATSQATTRIIMAPTFRDEPIGGIDVPVNGTALPDVAAISGWAIDRNSTSGTGVDAVSVYLDGGLGSGTLLGRAAYGDMRPGVALHFGDARFNRSGWHFTWDTTTVAPGNHTLSLVFHSSATGGSTAVSRRVSVGGGREISRGKPTQASHIFGDFTPAKAVDGLDATMWNSGAFAPQWIEVDLEAPVSIERLRLVTAQEPIVGFTSHRVFGRGATGSALLLHEFSGVTREAHALDYSPPAPWTGIRFVRVETVTSDAWVAWREISVYAERSTPTGQLSGLVRTSEAPVPGAQVELRSSDNIVQSAFTDERGSYAFAGIPAGTYTVRAYGPSAAYQRAAELTSQVLGAGANLQLETIALSKR
jgi:hypothetical protein